MFSDVMFGCSIISTTELCCSLLQVRVVLRTWICWCCSTYWYTWRCCY